MAIYLKSGNTFYDWLNQIHVVLISKHLTHGCATRWAVVRAIGAEGTYTMDADYLQASQPDYLFQEGATR